MTSNQQDDHSSKFAGESMPQVFAVSIKGSQARFSRRDFLKVTGAVGSVAALSACVQLPSPMPSPTTTPTQTAIPSSTPTATITPTPKPVKWLCSEVRAHNDAVDSLAMTPDGSYLVSGGRDFTVKFWSMDHFSLVKKIDLAGTSLAMSLDGSYLVVGSFYSNDIFILSVPDGEVLTTLKGHTDRVYQVAISKDGKLLASGGSDKTIRVWSLPDGAPLFTLNGHSDLIEGLAFAPDGSYLASASYDKTIKLWSLPDGKLLRTLNGKQDVLSSIAISPDGKILASGGLGNIILWSLPNGTALKTLEAEGAVLTMDPDGKTLISGGSSATVKFWSLPDGNPLDSLEYPQGNWLFSLLVSPDGKRLFIGYRGMIRILSLADGEELTCLADLAASSQQVQGSQYSVDVNGKTVEYTMPCGSAIPAGAVCTCNCVGGTGCSCVEHSSGGGTGVGGHYWYPN